MRDVPLAVPMGASLADIARRMEAEQASSATVLDAEGRPCGSVTEQDITRRTEDEKPEAPRSRGTKTRAAAGQAFVAAPPALGYQVLPFA